MVAVAPRAAGAQQSTAPYDYRANPTGHHSPPPETEALKPGDQGDNEFQLRRVMTLDETDGNDPSTVPPPTAVETDIFEPPPPPQRGMTSQEVANCGGLIEIREPSRRERDTSPAIENNIARRNTVASHHAMCTSQEVSAVAATGAGVVAGAGAGQ